MANTRRENRIEELGRVDAEKAETKKGSKNLWAEKKRIRKELKAKSGTIVTAQGGTMIKAKKGWGKKIAKAATAAGVAYAGSQFLKNKGMKGNVSKTAAMEDANIKSRMVDAADAGSKFIKSKGKVPYKKFTGIAKTGAMVTAKVGTIIKAKKGWGKKIAGAAAAAGAAYAGSKFLKSKGMKGSVSNMPHEDLNIKSRAVDAISGGTKFAKKKSATSSKLYDKAWGSGVMFKKGGSTKAKAGKMVKARGGAYIKTKLNGTLFTQTF